MINNQFKMEMQFQYYVEMPGAVLGDLFTLWRTFFVLATTFLSWKSPATLKTHPVNPMNHSRSIPRYRQMFLFKFIRT